MEDDLDRIAGGEAEPRRLAHRLLLRQRRAPRPAQRHRQPRRDRRARDQLDRASPTTSRCASASTARTSRSPIPTRPGGATPRRVNMPEDLAPDELTPAKAQELIDAPVVGDRVLGVNPANGKMIVAKDGRFGPYVTELDPEPEPPRPPSRRPRPATSSTPPPARSTPKPKKKPRQEGRRAQAAHRIPLQVDGPRRPIDLETALQAARPAARRRARPRVRRRHHRAERPVRPVPEEGHRHALARPSEDQIFDIDLPGALELFAQPKYGARRRRARSRSSRPTR